MKQPPVLCDHDFNVSLEGDIILNSITEIKGKKCELPINQKFAEKCVKH